VPLWVVILIAMWVVVCFAMVALAVSAGRIDKALGRRAARRPPGARGEARERPAAKAK
jgi:hypothetical protein